MDVARAFARPPPLNSVAVRRPWDVHDQIRRSLFRIAEHGRFNLPAFLDGDGGQCFRLTRATFGGGNGVVFSGSRIDRSENVDRVCAIKILRQQTQTSLDRFQNEVRILRSLNHKFITPYYDSGTLTLADSSGNSFEVPWVAMDLGDSNLNHHVTQKGPLDLPSLFAVGRQICDALQYFHDQGLLHRDLKPANVVWTSADHESIQLIDFGIAKYVGEDVSARPLDEFTRTQDFVGPVFFSSPELIAYAADKSVHVDHRSDLFQLGKLLWFLATGRITAGVPNAAQCPTGGALRDLVIQLIDDEPADRLQSAAEVDRALESLAASISL